ncbi:MAG TPA: hypothetical protein VMI75_09720, partial [Polyangiaceae bacterium]|nr:hypothetical protein [Polyangiaceae bacterium]
ICAPTLLAPANEPNTLAIDATSIYWADNAPGGGVAKVALTGGTPTSLASGATNAFALAIDGTNAYVVSLDPVINADILSVPLAGGTFTTIATNMYTTVGTGNLLVTGGNIYWAQASSGAIMSVSAGGGTPATLVSMQPFPDAIGTDGSNLYWTVDGNGAVTGEPMAVLSAPLGGNTPSTLYSYAPYTGTFSDLAVGPQDLYWIANGAIQTIPHGGASSLTPISNTAGGSNPRLPTIDGSNIYWAESGSVTDTILMVPLAGGTPFTITTGAPRVQSIVIGASCVYWSYYTNLANGGAVYQVTK